MSNICDKQTVIFSIDLNHLLPSMAIIPMNLRFAADEMVLKSLTYSQGGGDVDDAVQIWCDKTVDGLIASFPNNISQTYQHNEHFRISNSFQNGNMTFQFQTTIDGAPFFYNPQALISPNLGVIPIVVGHTTGIVSFTIEFLKLKDKSIY